MLNLELIKEEMARCGLNQAALADKCQVSRESVSNWLAGQSTPRPNKLKLIAEVLGQPMNSLFIETRQAPEPVIAYRTRSNTPVSPESANAALELARHLRQLVPFLKGSQLFAPPVLETPRLADEYVQCAARAVREKLGMGNCDPLTRARLLELHEDFGSVLVPVLWNGDLSGHENALSVWLPDSKTSFVIFSLNAKNDDFNYWLAHELGHCYTLHSLQGDDGERFAELFAQELLFPFHAAEEALAKIKASDKPLAQAKQIAAAFDISVITVIRQADKAAEALGVDDTGLETDEFWAEWTSTRELVPTVAYSLFGSAFAQTYDYLDRTERHFKTPIFKALSRWQHSAGGRSPSFIAGAFNIDLAQAFEISHALMDRRVD